MPNTSQTKDHFAPSSIGACHISCHRMQQRLLAQIYPGHPSASRLACGRMRFGRHSVASCLGRARARRQLPETPMYKVANMTGWYRMFPLRASHHSPCDSYSCDSSRVSIQPVYHIPRLTIPRRYFACYRRSAMGTLSGSVGVAPITNRRP